MEGIGGFALDKLKSIAEATIEFLLYGNKAEIDSDCDEKKLIECNLVFKDGTKVLGWHKGPRACKFMGNTCMGC